MQPCPINDGRIAVISAGTAVNRGSEKCVLFFSSGTNKQTRPSSLSGLRGSCTSSINMDARKIREKLKKGELKPRKKIGQRSFVWERFSEVVHRDDESRRAGYVICNNCEALYVYDSHKTGTSNMVHHVCSNKNKNQTDAFTSAAYRGSKIIPQEFMSELVDDCVDLCCLDMYPFDIVSGKGFAQVAQTFIDIGARFGAVDAHAIIPHRKTVRDRAKQQACVDKEKLYEVIQKVMEDSGIVGLTTDTWTDEFNKREYTVMTCHYISEEWQLDSRILGTVELDSDMKNTTENSHDPITYVLMSYGIPQDKVFFVSDQGPNVMAEHMTKHWIPCSAHILNTVLKVTFSENNAPEGIKHVVEMLEKCKSLVIFLKGTEDVENLAQTVVHECEVRWNSKVNMLESILKQYSGITKLLEDRGQLHLMEGIFEDQLMSLVEFLTLFKLALNELEEDRYPTLHMVLLWFLKLKKHCEPKCGDPSYIALLRARASSLLEEKMLLTPTHKVATFLCPRFKSLKMLTPEDRQEVLRHVRMLINEEPSVSQNAGEGTSVINALSTAGQGVFASRQVKRQKVDFTEWEDETPMDEVEEYCSTMFQPEESSEENLLSFWEKQDASFPGLQHLAKRILCIPATCAASERSFSTARRIIEKRQSRLDPGSVDAVLFLYSAKKRFA